MLARKSRKYWDAMKALGIEDARDVSVPSAVDRILNNVSLCWELKNVFSNMRQANQLTQCNA